MYTYVYDYMYVCMYEKDGKQPHMRRELAFCCVKVVGKIFVYT